MGANNIPLSDFPVSVMLGMAVWLLHPHEHPYTTYTYALGASAAAWCVVPVLVSRARWRGLEVVTLALLAFGALLIIRPIFVSTVMMHLPLFRSLRWPFREFVQFQFFLHLYLLIRPPGLSARAPLASAIFGTIMYIIPMWLYPLPPTFNSMNWDRELIFTGGADRFWAKVRPMLRPDDRIAVIIPLGMYQGDRFEEPYSLMGTFNYACMFGIVNAWGYSPTVPRDQTYTRTYAFYNFGAYHPNQRDALLKENPHIRIISLDNLQPLKITLSSRDGPPIDLTPLIPPRTSKIPAGAAYLHELEEEEKRHDAQTPSTPSLTPVAKP